MKSLVFFADQRPRPRYNVERNHSSCILFIATTDFYFGGQRSMWSKLQGKNIYRFGLDG